MRRFRSLLLCLTLALVASSLDSNRSVPNPFGAKIAHAQPGKGDAAGGTTGNINDLATAGSTLQFPLSPQADIDKTKKQIAASGPGVQFLADAEGQTRTGVNMMWLLVCGFLVMFMQAGFALVETGFTRSKNAAHTMMMNFGCYFLGITGFWICGFAFMYGNAGPIFNVGGTPSITGGHVINMIGIKGTFAALNGFFLAGNTYDVGTYGMFLFQMVFMDTAVTIVTGTMCERWKMSNFILYCFFMSCILYPIFGHWAWGGGWLGQLGNNYGFGCGYVDFAGSGVVHAVGGLCGLAGAMVIGPRIGKFNKDGSANAIPGHNIPIAVLGVLILGFGWFGFNPGSTFGAAGFGNLRIAIVATSTMLASAGAGMSAMLYSYAKVKKFDVGFICNGFLAGLVAITAPSGFVGGPVAFFIGAVAAILVCSAMGMVEKMGIDDPVGAFSVHGVGGLFGVLCVGLFADGTYGAGWNLTASTSGGVADKPLLGLIPAIMAGQTSVGVGQLTAQLIGIVTLIIWAWGASYVFFTICKKTGGIRVSPEVEIAGLDMPEVNALAYPPDDVNLPLDASGGAASKVGSPVAVI